MNGRPAIFHPPLATMALFSALLILSLSQTSCSSFRLWCWGCGGSAEKDARLHHIVLLWQKLPGNPTHRKRLIEACREFEDIPGVKSARVGAAVLSNRDVVDDSFDVALILSFEDRYTLRRYLDHPDHQKALEETLAPLVERIVVYDFLEPNED